MIKFSIVLISYNRKETVLKTLDKVSCLPQQNYEIILVDNGSVDETCYEVKQKFPQVKLICLKNNRGIEAYNIGFKIAKGQYLVVLDDDSYPSPQVLDMIEAEFSDNPSLAIIAGRINNYDNTIQWPRHIDYQKRQEVNLFAGCGFVIKKDVFERVGFYPAHYFMFYNENYVANKILLEKMKILYDPNIIFYHQSPPESRFNDFRIYYMARNHFWNIIQFCPKNKLFFNVLRHWKWLIMTSWRFHCWKGCLKGIFSSFFSRGFILAIKNRQPVEGAHF